MTEQQTQNILKIIEQVRADMNDRLDQIAECLRAEAGPAESASRRKPRAPLRPAYKGAVVPTDIDRAKAREVLKRMRLVQT